ncbi:MAG: transcription antitermination factor NusB [Bacteroidales bacterium]|jgi:N utilization substance protein B|nr:transcription antitermination factor NusB [Bacteroidales bacterium]
MLNRRFLRVKALQAIYAYHQSESSNLPQAERQLLDRVDDLYKLFVYQLSFWVEIKRFAERRIEENKQKHFPTEEDLNPNMKFVNNRILVALDDNKHLMKLEEQYKIDWTDSREDFIRKMFVKLTETPEYQEYMSNGKDSFSDDKRFLVTVIETYMPENGLLYDYYSDRDLSFTSDYQLAIYLLWKFISELPANFDASSMLPPVYKSEEEDREFVTKLFEKTILHADEYMEMVKDNISNWDYERLALMDKILIFMAMTEFCEFHSIPVKVTINEYIEISKFYSTPESRRFVNGMLDRLSTMLKEEGKLVKTGLGLVDK